MLLVAIHHLPFTSYFLATLVYQVTKLHLEGWFGDVHAEHVMWIVAFQTKSYDNLVAWYTSKKNLPVKRLSIILLQQHERKQPKVANTFLCICDADSYLR